MNINPTQSRIFITGATTGIGKALALAYAGKGTILGLAARRADLLLSVAKQCQNLGAKVQIYPLDVQDQLATAEAAKAFVKLSGGIDIVIANAGIGGHDNIIHGDATTINTIIKVNLLGVTNTLVPFIPIMKNQISGKLVIISSVLAFFPMPYHGGYSASKTALKRLADSWRITLKKYGIQISTICPGYVDTPMTEKQHARIFLLSADEAAQKIKRAVARGRKTLIFPWQMKILLPLIEVIPKNIFRWANDRFK
ncbi:MAG: SDR family NAD(P)-dependent oxidoreductase [Fidelibacterota bacterium]